VPSEDRLRPYQHEVPAPIGNQPPNNDPEEPVVPAHVTPPPAAQRDGELLPQEHVLHHEGLPAPKGDESSADEERPPVQHGAMIADGVSHRADGVLGPYRTQMNTEIVTPAFNDIWDSKQTPAVALRSIKPSLQNLVDQG
jgi:hypothetical protein